MGSKISPSVLEVSGRKFLASKKMKIPGEMNKDALKRLLCVYLDTEAPEQISKIYEKEPMIKIRTILKTARRDVQDILFHIHSILRYPQCDEEYFISFLVFGDRLKPLCHQLREEKPRTVLQMWSDRRNVTQSWTFWLVQIIGIPGLLLALGSFIAGTIQTWASVKALHG